MGQALQRALQDLVTYLRQTLDEIEAAGYDRSAARDVLVNLMSHQIVSGEDAVDVGAIRNAVAAYGVCTGYPEAEAVVWAACKFKEECASHPLTLSKAVVKSRAVREILETA